MRPASLSLALVIVLGSYLPMRADPLLCFGDSQTVGVREGVRPGEEWCSLLARRTGRTAINKGVGGNTTNDALARIDADVLQQPGSCVAVMLGANDGWRDPRSEPSPPAEVTVERYENNISNIIMLIKERGKDVTLMTPWPFISAPTLHNMDGYVQAARAAAVKTRTPLIDVYTSSLMRWFDHCNIGSERCEWFDRRYTDYQHPSAEGHAEIASLCSLPQNSESCACKAAN
ncbi:SGNH/GDSL hydrolase family protein [Tardiphaga sp. 866_E4_N2_1]|uniref:SGNH/GDSL hydrolase family protein n=1 Tax=unclassified Tardiphaga TaxID=2631404 RepID=UPI003F27924B